MDNYKMETKGAELKMEAPKWSVPTELGLHDVTAIVENTADSNSMVPSTSVILHAFLF